MKKFLIVMLCVCACRCHAQDSTLTVEGFESVDGFKGRKIISTGMLGGLLVGSLIFSYNAWWKNARGDFKFHADNWLSGGQLGIDKAGHLYTSYFYFHTIRNTMLWGGYKPSTAFWWAAGTTAFFAVSVEIGDGVSDYAFDYQDLVFNFAGLGYAMLQTEIPFLKNFDLKWTYVPDGGLQWPQHLTDNYDAHTYWLSTNVHGLLPESLKDYWPEFLQLAVGYSVTHNVTRGEGVIGLDFNLEVFPVHNQDLLLLQKTVNMFHFPAPAVKFAKHEKPQYYFFHLK